MSDEVVLLTIDEWTNPDKCSPVEIAVAEAILQGKGPDDVPDRDREDSLLMELAMRACWTNCTVLETCKGRGHKLCRTCNRRDKS
ncbi:MAG: hypothetical protein WC444_04300 [Candidatus Paceibacterota bacterium]